MVPSVQLAQPFAIMVHDIQLKPPVHDALTTAGVASCKVLYVVLATCGAASCIVPIAVATAGAGFFIVHNALETACAAQSIVQGALLQLVQPPVQYMQCALATDGASSRAHYAQPIARAASSTAHCALASSDAASWGGKGCSDYSWRSLLDSTWCSGYNWCCLICNTVRTCYYIYSLCCIMYCIVHGALAMSVEASNTNMVLWPQLV
jgi:hypothetical protein